MSKGRAKATHQGTCQVCGHLQKLPGGVLSLHGYEVRWNCFNGMCWGARSQPFELAKDLIEKAIKRATEDANNTEAAATRIETDPDPKTIWVHEYIAATWERRYSSYEWRELKIEDVRFNTYESEGVTRYDGRFFWTPREREGTPTKPQGGQQDSKDNPAAIIRGQAIERAKEWRGRVAQLRQYVKWQKARIKDWQPHPEKLIAVEADAPRFRQVFGDGRAAYEVARAFAHFGIKAQVRRISMRDFRHSLIV